jgi:hypothetical protein
MLVIHLTDTEATTPTTGEKIATRENRRERKIDKI